MTVSQATNTTAELDKIQQAGAHHQILPSELVDYVIDFLHDDSVSLGQCSLVSRAWLPTSSLHLFERLSWPPCPHAYEMGRRATVRCKCDFLDRSTFWSKLSHLLSSSTRITRHVQTLRIYFQWTVADQRGWGAGRTERHRHKATPSEIAAVMDSLPHLRWLMLYSPHFVHDAPYAAPVGLGKRALDRLTLEYPAPSLAPHDQLASLADFLQLFSRISLLQLTDVMKQNTHYHPIPLSDPSVRPEIHSLRVDVASSLAFVQFLRIVTATACLKSLSSIAVNHLVDNTSLQGLAPLLKALPNLRSLLLNGSHSTQILQSDLANALPCLRALTVAGLIIVESTPRSLMDPTWASLRSVAACPIRSVRELVLRFTLEGRRLEDNRIRYGLGLRMLEWSLLDAVLDAYDNVALELELDRPSLAGSLAQMAAIVRDVESVARGWMSERARESIHLRVYWCHQATTHTTCEDRRAVQISP